MLKFHQHHQHKFVVEDPIKMHKKNVRSWWNILSIVYHNSSMQKHIQHKLLHFPPASHRRRRVLCSFYHKLENNDEIPCSLNSLKFNKNYFFLWLKIPFKDYQILKEKRIWNCTNVHIMFVNALRKNIKLIVLVLKS